MSSNDVNIGSFRPGQSGSQMHRPTEDPSAQEPQDEVTAVRRYKAFADAHSRLWSLQRDIAALLEYSAEQFAELTSSHCFISFLSIDKVRLIPMAAASRHKKSAPMLSQFLQAKPAPVAKNAAEETLTSLQASFAGSEKTEGGGGRGSRKAAVGMLMVPLRVANEAVGLLTLLREKEREPFAREEVDLVQNLADHLSLIVQLNRLQPLANMAANRDAANGQFLAELCAELQGPMHALDGYASMVQEQVAEAGMDELEADASCLREAATAVNQTLNDLLHISRMEKADFKSAVEKVSLREFVSDLEMEMQTLPGSHDLKLYVNSDDLASSITIDPLLARQAVTSVRTAMCCTANAVHIEGICTNNQFVLTLTCEEDLAETAPVSSTCTLSYSNTLELTENVKYGNGQRGVAMALATRIVRLLHGELEVEFQDNVMVKTILKFPLN